MMSALVLSCRTGTPSEIIDEVRPSPSLHYFSHRSYERILESYMDLA